MAGRMYAYYAGNAQISATEHFQRKPFDLTDSYYPFIMSYRLWDE